MQFDFNLLIIMKLKDYLLIFYTINKTFYIFAADESGVHTFGRNAGKQFLAMRLYATHDIGNTTGAGNY
jgi:hypothetical protein